MRPICAHLHEEDYEELRKICIREGISLQEGFRRAVKTFIEEESEGGFLEID